MKVTTCFIIMPFAPEFLPVCEAIRDGIEKGVSGQAIRADDSFRPGNVVEQLKEAIADSDFCVADITGNNPNVMWEVGYACGVGKPVIALRQHTEGIPFDVRADRLFTYQLSDLSQLRGVVASAAMAVVSDLERQPNSLAWRYDELNFLLGELKRCRPRRSGDNLLALLITALARSRGTAWRSADHEVLVRAIHEDDRVEAFWWLIVFGVLIYKGTDDFFFDNGYANNLSLVTIAPRGLALIAYLEELARRQI